MLLLECFTRGGYTACTKLCRQLHTYIIISKSNHHFFFMLSVFNKIFVSSNFCVCALSSICGKLFLLYHVDVVVLLCHREMQEYWNLIFVKLPVCVYNENYFLRGSKYA